MMRYFGWTLALLVAGAAPARAQLGDSEAEVRCIAVMNELAQRHDKASAVYDAMTPLAADAPAADKAKRAQMQATLDKMAEVSMEIAIYYFSREVPADQAEAFRRKPVPELIAMGEACVNAEIARIDAANK